MAPHRKASGTTLPSSSNTNVTTSSCKTARNGRSKRCTNGTHNIDYTNLQLSDVLCPLCRNVLIEPVTLPCQHCFCWRCLQGIIVQQVDRGAETCPQCQVRFGGWYRTAKKHHKLLTNQPLWNAIRKVFLKADNPFLSNGLRSTALACAKQVPTTSRGHKTKNSALVPASATPPALLLTVRSDSSNDSTWAIRRDCNHFRPIDGPKDHLNMQQHLRSGQQTSNIVRVPATRKNKTAELVAPSGNNLFFSDPRLSAFCLVRRLMPGNTQTPYEDAVQIVEESEVIEKLCEEIQRDRRKCHHISSKLRYRHNVTSKLIKNEVEPQQSNAATKVPTSDTTTVIMLQKPHRSNQFKWQQQNGLLKGNRVTTASNTHKSEKRKTIPNNNNLTMGIKNNTRKCSNSMKKEQPQRQSARIVAAAASIAKNNIQQRNEQSLLQVNHHLTSVNCTYNRSSDKNGGVDQIVVGEQLESKQAQLQVDHQLARQLHRLLNGGATRSNAASVAPPTLKAKSNRLKAARGSVASRASRTRDIGRIREQTNAFLHRQ